MPLSSQMTAQGNFSVLPKVGLCVTRMNERSESVDGESLVMCSALISQLYNEIQTDCFGQQTTEYRMHVKTDFFQ